MLLEEDFLPPNQVVESNDLKLGHLVYRIWTNVNLYGRISCLKDKVDQLFGSIGRPDHQNLTSTMMRKGCAGRKDLGEVLFFSRSTNAIYPVS